MWVKHCGISHTGTFSWKPTSVEFFWSDELYRILEVEPPPSIAIVRERMADAAQLTVPLDVQIGRGADWSEAGH